MKVLNTKTIATATVMALTLGFGVNHANAQATATIGGNITTAPALAAAAGNDIDFGTWAVNVAGGDTPSFVQQPNTGVPTAPTPAGVVDASTILQNVTPSTGGGTIDVTSPITGNVQLQGAITDFASPNITLSALTYTDSVVAPAANTAVPAAYDGTVVQIQTAGVAETIGFGGTITFPNTPLAGTPFTDASIQVDFAY